jgi:hypothetical protein
MKLYFITQVFKKKEQALGPKSEEKGPDLELSM